MGSQTYRITIAEGQVVDNDNCASESYEPILAKNAAAKPLRTLQQHP